MSRNLFEECFTVDLFYGLSCGREGGEGGRKCHENLSHSDWGEQKCHEIFSAGDSRWIVFLGPPFEEERKCHESFWSAIREKRNVPNLRDVETFRPPATK